MWSTLYIIFALLTDVNTYSTGVISSGGIKRVYDVTGLPVHSIVIKAGENKSISCPGVNEHSLILELEWLSLTNHLSLVEFMSDSTTVWVNQHRISLLSDSFGLSFHPAAAEDSGDYICLVNSRPKPDALVRLIVQDVPEPPGRPLIMSFTSRSVNLSWAPSQDTHHSPVTHYIIHTRKTKTELKKRDFFAGLGETDKEIMTGLGENE
ncbi:hypothetical protein QE152_g33020 [Popillia japonica]|uniref:Ig-like domain-containing protein n=1 Tax=Popillia japonica TaxID=7064 RepID=A0AAW1IY00_POPJA